MPAMEYYGTLGPACASVDCLAEMFEAGMTGMRLNPFLLWSTWTVLSDRRTFDLPFTSYDHRRIRTIIL